MSVHCILYCRYLSRLVGVQGWTLLACSVMSTDHYNVKCPAFALVARQPTPAMASDHSDSCSSSSAGSEGGSKEALLVIRGSSSMVDVKINMNDKLRPFTYWQGTGKQGDGPLQAVEGQVHETMLDGALKILDLYGMRSCLSQLLETGFDVKIVGHSLGASTACLLAAEIKNGYADAFNQQETQEQRTGQRRENNGAKSVAFSGNIPRVVAIGFGCPPCVDACVGDAILADDLFLSVVHRDDIVPRLSRTTLERLAGRVLSYAEEAARMRREDTESFKSYAVTYGLAHDMSERTGAAEKENKKKGMQDKKEVGGKGEEAQVLHHDEVDMSLLLIDDDEGDACEFDKDTDDKNSESGGEGHNRTVGEAKHQGGSNCGDDRKIEEENVGGVVNEPEQEQGRDALVVPGKIIYLSFSQGGYRATLCDHRLDALSEVSHSARRTHSSHSSAD